MRYRKQRNYGCRIHDQYMIANMRIIVIENDKIRISINVDKGTEIFEYLYKPRDLDYMWLTENGIQNPNSYLSTSADPIANFTDYYTGGWQEIFPNGGPTCTYMGAQFGQHGEIANMPWDYSIDLDTPEKVEVCFSVRTNKVPFRIKKTLTIEHESASLHLKEELENVSNVPLQYMWGQHIAFGEPFLTPNCRIHLPENIEILTEAANLNPENYERFQKGQNYKWPFSTGIDGEIIDLSIIPERNKTSDICYLTGFGQEAWYEIINEADSVGMRVEWDSASFPYLWYWQEFGGIQSYPWYGRNYNIGLEPFSSYPTLGLAEAIKRGKASQIGSNETRRFWMTTTPFILK